MVTEAAKDIQFGTELPMDKEVLSTWLHAKEASIPLSVTICVSSAPPLPSARAGGEGGSHSQSPAPQQQLDGNFSNIVQFMEIYDLDSDSNGLHLTEAI